MNKMENLNKKLKNNKGSIMSFTLISMMFFLVVVIAIYASVNTKVQKQQKELNTIQKSYEQQEQINDIYEKKYNDYINSETSTLQVYADNNLKGEVKGQKKNTIGTVYTNIAQNKIKIFGGANSTYAYSETADGKKQTITGNEIPIQATKDGKTIYTWVKGEDGEYTKYYTAVTVKLSTLQDKTIYVAEGKSIDIGEINGENKGKITYDNIDNNMIKIENNQITGIKAGNTTFTATESNGGAQATITVKITKLTLEIQKGITILGTNKIIEVSGTNYGALTVKSNDETIAKATVNGTQVTIIPQKVGNIKITITEQNAGASIDYEIQIANVILAPNGGKYTMPTTGKAILKTQVKVENANKIEVAWTSSNLEWKTIENNSEITKKDCDKGTYYLYVKIDNEALYQSQAFIVGEEKIAINIKTSTTEWTNKDIIATIEYPDVTVNNTRKAGYGTTLNDAQTAAKSATAPTTSVTVTANGYVFATATDAAGNVVTASQQITNIDKEDPTISKTEVKNVTTTGYDVYVYGVQDSGSGVNRVQFPTWTTANGQDDIQSNWTTNITAKGTKQSDGTTWIYHVNVTDHNNEAGEYNTHVYVYDNLGNSKSISTHLITVPAVEITYDNNYLNKNLWNDTQDLSRYYSATTAPSSKINVDNESALFGKTIEFTMNAGNGGGPYYANNTALTVGKTYTWSVYVKTNTNRTMRIGQEQGGYVDLKVTTEWQKFTYTFTAVSRNVKAFVFYAVGQNWSAGDKLYIHSLEIEEGDGSSNKTKENKGYNSKLGTLDIPTRTGYTFDGWYTDPTGGTKITSETTTPASNTTYYAHWTINEYTIDLNLDVDSTTYWSGYNSRIYVGFKIGGVDKGYIQDYREKSPYGTKWEIYGARLDGINVAYTDSGILGAGSLDLRAKFYTLTLAVNNTDYGSITPTNLIVPRNNTTYSVNGTKLTLSDGRTANASVTDATGYTTTLTGWSPTSGTISQATTVTANITRTPNQYTLTINPNGGKYNNTTANSTFVQSYDTVKNIGTASPPSSCTITYNGNGGTASKSADTSNKAFSGWTKSGTGEYISTTAPSTTSGFVRTAKYDTSNGNYDNFKYSLSSAPTANTWYLIRYPVYTYTSGHTYEIRYKLRINSVVASGLYFRHAAVFNDYGTAGSVTNTYTTATNGWVDVVQTRTISGATIELGSNKLNVTPMFEIYTTNLKNSMASADFDVKDLMIIDKTSDKLLQGNANLFWYKNGNGTLTANYTAFAKIKLATATKKGYTFSGWYDAATGGNKIGDANADYTPTESKTLYAHYNANTYTINYNGNGATSGSTVSSTHTYDVAKNLTTNGFSKSGYTFLGWSTNASATSATYTNSQSVKNLTETANGSITLYAIWKDATAPTMLTPTIIPTSWTNGNVTISSGARDSGSLIRAYQWSTSQNITATSSGWINLNTMSEAITQSYTAKENGTYYFYAKDGSGNVGVTSIKISTIDRTAPSANISLNSTTATTDGSVIATVTHSDTGGSGVKISGAKWVLNTTSGNIGTNASSYNGGTFSSNPQSITLKATTIGNYYLHVLTVDNAGNAKETISDAICISTRLVDLVNNGTIKIGDYIKYTPDPVKTTDATYKNLLSSWGEKYSGTNQNTSSNIIQDGNLNWRVLDVENGKVRLISDNSTSNKFKLIGIQGYNNAVYLLDTTCSTLYNSKLANKVQNLKKEDILGKLSVNINSIEPLYGQTVETKQYRYYPSILTQEKNATINGKSGTLGVSEQNALISQSGMTLANSLKLVHTAIGTRTMNVDYFKSEIYYKLLMESSDNSFWLSSRAVIPYDTYSYFRIEDITAKNEHMIGTVAMCDTQNSGRYIDENPNSLRPVITLDEDVILDPSDNKNGSSADSAYKIKLGMSTLAKKVEIGDYVAYDATNNYSYTSPKGTGMSHGNGDSDQKFTSSSNIKWKVLSKNETSGEVVLVSEKSIDTNGLKINGAIGYLYAEEELNKACSIYGHGVGADTSKTFSYITGNSSDENITGKLTGSGARSITLGDINKITGYETSGANTGIEKRYYPTTKTNTGYSTTAEDKLFEYECDPYNVNEYLNDKESNIYKLLFSEGYTYWCASRMVNEYETTLYFQVGFIDSSDVLGADVGAGDYNNFDNSYSDWYGIRPIVYLKTNLKTNGKDSKGAWTIIE